MSAHLDAIASALEASYAESSRGHIGERRLPSPDVIVEIVRLCVDLFYPGYHGRQDRTSTLLSALETKLATEIATCLGEGADARGREIAEALVTSLPGIRAALLEDVEAAYAGDPAATSYDEILLAYPGLVAITVHRVAHQLYSARVPLMPRIMSEWAHTRSGADIHPGAKIGRRFFIDHATGVVIGETTVIGNDVKLYQGVTLGALSVHKDAQGQRHPTVEDGVTIYANATVLGGRTIIGEGSVIGGGVFITKSVPPRSRVSVSNAGPQYRGAATVNAIGVFDFE